MRYIIFSRVSTKKQSTIQQRLECFKEVQKIMKFGDEILFYDEPETSSRTPMEDRKKLQEMLAFVRSGDTVVIYKLDRLARDGEELVYIYRSKLIKKGINVISLYEPHIDNANIHIYAFLGETERNNIRLRTISSLHAKQEAMEKVGTTWYGYKTDETKLQPRQDVHSSNKPYLLIPDEDEIQQVSLMYELRKQGQTYGEIAHELERQGFRNRKGNPIHKKSVWCILKRLEKQRQCLEHLQCA